MINLGRHESDGSKRQQNWNMFPWFTISKESWIHLIISWFNFVFVFIYKRKWYFIPISISPLSTDQKRDMREAFWLLRFYCKIEIISSSAFKIMDSWILKIAYLLPLQELSQTYMVMCGYSIGYPCYLLNRLMLLVSIL